VLLIVRGENADVVAARLAEDPWPPRMLATVWVRPWDLLVGSLD